MIEWSSASPRGSKTAPPASRETPTSPSTALIDKGVFDDACFAVAVQQYKRSKRGKQVEDRVRGGMKPTRNQDIADARCAILKCNSSRGGKKKEKKMRGPAG